MRATIILFALTIIVSVAGVAWVNSRSPVEEEESDAVEQPVPLQRAMTPEEYDARRQARLDAILAQRRGEGGFPVTATRQLAAEQARAQYGLKGCFDSGEKCRCLGRDNQPVSLSPETCRIVASEPQVMQQ